MQAIADLKYHDIGFIAFYHCMADPTQLDRYGIDSEKWKEIKELWQRNNPDKSEFFEMYRVITIERSKLDKFKTLLLRYRLDPNVQEKTLKDAGLKIPKEDPVRYLLQKIEYQERLVQKRESALEKKVKKEAEEREKNPDSGFDMQTAFKSLAALEKHTTIDDYFEFPLYKYEALTKVLSDGERKN